MVTTIRVFLNLFGQVDEFVGDTILTHQSSYDDDAAISLLRNLQMDEDEISELGKNPIRSKHTGVIADHMPNFLCWRKSSSINSIFLHNMPFMFNWSFIVFYKFL